MDYGEIVAAYEFDTVEWPKRFLFLGTGSMTYPEGEMRHVWEGRGFAGSGTHCLITADEIRLRPREVFRRIQGWPELVLPRKDIRGVEKVFQGRYRFRSDNRFLDSACYRPSGGRDSFLAALGTLGIPISEPPTKDKLTFELRMAWNQVGWGGRLRRRHWKRERHEPA
jgi:hypothetical protein